MFKKIFNYSFFLNLFFVFVIIIFFGAVLKYHYEGGKRFQSLQKIANLLASIPLHTIVMIENKSLNLNKPAILKRHKNKKRFQKFIDTERSGLLVLPRYVNDLNRSVVDIVDLKDFKVIHTYKHDVDHMNDQVINKAEFPRLKIDGALIRFQYFNPIILENGSLISQASGPLFKIDFCSKLKWLNDQEVFHHSISVDSEKNIWVPSRMSPHSKNVESYEIKNFYDDSITKLNLDGKILYQKSVIEILIENKILPENYAVTMALANHLDPIHLNDIEPALTDTKYWKKGDVFLSIRTLSSIIHFRPSSNKIINYITGPFAMQHDVDFVSDKEISIFNNNNFPIESDYSEVLIYNFETKTFRKLFDDQLKKENFKTYSQGELQILNDGSLMVEEQNHGRIIFFNNQGEKEWEFVNKDLKGDINRITWSSIIEDEIFIKNFKLLLKNKKC